MGTHDTASGRITAFSEPSMNGIHAARSPYVLLLNNDTEAEPDFLEEVVAALRRHKKAFSVRQRCPAS